MKILFCINYRSLTISLSNPYTASVFLISSVPFSFLFFETFPNSTTPYSYRLPKIAPTPEEPLTTLSKAMRRYFVASTLKRPRKDEPESSPVALEESSLRARRRRLDVPSSGSTSLHPRATISRDIPAPRG